MAQVTIEDLLAGRVRLEFGNNDQLVAIRTHEKRLEEKATRCGVCDGEGMVTCDACDGSGEKPAA